MCDVISLARANQSQAKFKCCGWEFAAKLGEFDNSISIEKSLLSVSISGKSRVTEVLITYR